MGDALLTNTVAYHLARQAQTTMLAGTPHPEMFLGNPLVKHLPFRSQKIGHRTGQLLKIGGIIDSFHYLRYQEPSSDPSRPWLPPQAHILKILSDQAGLKNIPSRPLLFLSQTELLNHALPDKDKPWIAMQSTGISSWTENKNWGGDNFARVSDSLKSICRIVQIGLASDPPLSCDKDLRGRLSARETAATLASCALFIGQPGFLMHAAAAVDIPAVIVYGGFEAPWQSGYPWNTNLFTTLSCSPCWLTSTCPYGKMCLAQISPAQVTEAAHKMLSRMPAAQPSS